VATIWRATSGDVPEVARLLGEFRDWWGYDGPSDESLVRDVGRLVEDPDTEYLLAAADGARPAAVCQLRFRYGLWLESEDCWFEDLYVSESARRAGLGRALVEAAAERARERGCRRIQLDVNEANAGALALYESLGFSSWSEPLGGHNRFMQRRLGG
jgi:ribosomal protein S18 acetylase RimI-like enzyme